MIALVGAINNYRKLKEICANHKGSCKECPLGKQKNVLDTMCPHLTKPMSWTEEKTTEMVRKIGGI